MATDENVAAIYGVEHTLNKDKRRQYCGSIELKFRRETIGEKFLITKNVFEVGEPD